MWLVAALFVYCCAAVKLWNNRSMPDRLATCMGAKGQAMILHWAKSHGRVI
jgi:hypothetical protein